MSDSTPLTIVPRLWKRQRLGLLGMKLIYALCTVILSLTLCQAQESNDPQQAPDDAYTHQLVRLISGLQKNPWQGWDVGTEVLVRYLVDRNAAGITVGHAQPDLLYKVIEQDKLFIRTYVFKGKPGQQDFQVKDQVGLDVAWPWEKDTTITDLEIDGFRLSCLLSELTVHTFPGGTMVTKEWTLASHPSIIVRKEVVGGPGWKVTSTRVIKKIGERDFQCVEIKKWMRFHSGGPTDDMTTQYLCPDVPGHMVEEINEFYRIKRGERSSSPFQIVHQKVVELKIQKPGRT